MEDRGKHAPLSFEDLDAWQAARKLTSEVYSLCRTQPLNSDFGLCHQLRRAAVSVMNNIAERWESLHPAEKKQACNYARRSCGEVRSMTYVLIDNNLISAPEHESLVLSCTRTGKLASGLIRSLDSRT